MKVYNLENLAYLYKKDGQLYLKVIFTDIDFNKILLDSSNSIHSLNFDNINKYGLIFNDSYSLGDFLNKEKSEGAYFVVKQYHKIEGPYTILKEYYYNIGFSTEINIKDCFVKPNILIYNNMVILSITFDKSINRSLKIKTIKEKIKCH